MKKSVLAVFAAAALCSSWAAQAEDSYVTFGVGQGRYDLTGGKDSKIGLAIAFGQSLTKNWGYEIGYANFGKWSHSFNDGEISERLSIRTQSLYAAAVGTLPLNESFALFGKFGVAVNHTKAKGEGTEAGANPGDPPEAYQINDSMVKASPMVGVGASYNLSKEIAVFAQYQYFGKVAGDLTMDSWNAGLKYSF